MGFMEGIWALAGGVGPVLGGLFASLVTWRWCCKCCLSFFFSSVSGPVLWLCGILFWIVC